MAGTSFAAPHPTIANLYVRETVSTDSNLIIAAYCTGAPDTTANTYEHGCVMTRTDSGTGSPAVYQNVGSSASPSWTLLTTDAAPQVKTVTALGTVQNSTPTAAQLIGGIVTQTSATGAGTVTLPTGTLLSGAVANVVVGSTFVVYFSNLGGGFTLTITGATGSTVVGTAAIASAKNGILTFVNSGTNTWNVYVTVSA